MRRALKIVGICLGSLIGFLLLVECVVCYVILTPERVTPVVNDVCDKVITCEHEIGEVDLTFFSTFPRLGLRIHRILLVNPMDGAQSDTVLAADQVLLKANLYELFHRRYLDIDALVLDSAIANIYINAVGENNISVFVSQPDTTTEEKSAFTLPFDSIRVTGGSITAQCLTFVDDKDTIHAAMQDVDIDLAAANWDNVQLDLAANDVFFRLKKETYADHLQLGLNIPASVNLNTMTFGLRHAQVSINEFDIDLDGSATIQDTIALQLTAELNKWDIANVLALLPPSIASFTKDIQAQGLLSLKATADGMITDSVMPLIDATIRIDRGTAQYAALPYTFTDVELDADAHIDLNDQAQTSATIRKVCATTLDSKVSASAKISNLLADMRARAQLYMDVNIPDFASYFPENMSSIGQIVGGCALDARLSDLTSLHLEKTQIEGKWKIKNLDWAMDSMQAQLPEGELILAIPNQQPSHKQTDWLNLQLHTSALYFAQAGGIDAQLGNTQLHVETDNILQNMPHLCAYAELTSSDKIEVSGDSLFAQAYTPAITAFTECTIGDSTAIPAFETTISFKDLQGYYTQYQGRLHNPRIVAKMNSSRRSKTTPVFSADISSDAIAAQVGEDTKVSTKHIAVNAKAIYFPQGDKFLLKWNPRLNFMLNDAEVDLPNFEQHISIPQILFSYNNREFTIRESLVKIGHSDFALAGQIENIGKWIQEKGKLFGELTFTSNHTDVNELMSLCSADAGSEEKPLEETVNSTSVNRTSSDSAQAEPFLVPQNVDLTLTTDIKEAVIFNTTAHNIGGKLYIKDGMLVLEEMGFVCDAAKLQLTAMYRTPRRNHIYLGFDYHMLDIKIDQLIFMIPQVDSMVPMLRSFKGDAEFHIAAETFLTAEYKLKPSTLRGACSIFGKDLVLLDSETFDKISKILMFKKGSENKVDSISVEMTMYKKEIDLYPFCVSLGNYTAALGGRHNLDMTFDYHINLLRPLYIGVDVKGSLDDLSIKPAKCIYAQDFRPIIHNKVNTQNAELRQIIRDSLRKNVKTE